MDEMLEKIKGCINQIPPKRIVEIIVKYGFTLSDFSDMEPSKLNMVIQLLEEYNQKNMDRIWHDIRGENPSMEVLIKIVHNIEKFPIELSDKAKAYLRYVADTIVCPQNIIDIADICMRVVLPSDTQFVRNALQKMKYWGDVSLNEADFCKKLLNSLMESNDSFKKDYLAKSLICWGDCVEAIGRCWPCLPMHKLTESEENEILMRRICIAADYIHVYPNSLFCNSAYSIISNDIDHLDTRFLRTEEIRRYIDNNNTILRQMFISTFAHKLGFEEHELLSYVYIDVDWQSDFYQRIFMDNYNVIHNDCHPRTIILNIGFWNCGKTSFLMGLSQVHMDDYSIQWENDFDKNAQNYLNKGIYPAHNTTCYSIYSAHIQNKKKDTYLQFVDCDFNRFGKQFVDGEDIIDSETLYILRNKDSKIINFLISLEELDKVYNYWKEGIQLFIGQDNIINAILQSLDRYILWKRVKKINIIITKCDNYKSKKSMSPQIIANKNSGNQFDYSLIEDTLGGKYVGFFNDICDICEKWNIKSELFYFSIGTPVLADRYKYNDNYAKVIMHSIIADIPFSNDGIITRFINNVLR